MIDWFQEQALTSWLTMAFLSACPLVCSAATLTLSVMVLEMKAMKPNNRMVAGYDIDPSMRASPSQALLWMILAQLVAIHLEMARGNQRSSTYQRPSERHYKLSIYVY
jgi:hypothetical protein